MKSTLFIMIILFFSCSEKNKNEFSLKGKTTGIENGTVLYLYNISSKKSIDSVKVQNDTFSLKTKLPKTPLQIILRTKDNSNYRFMWLENSPMTFDQRQTDFRNAVVTGSQQESLSQSLFQKIDTLPRDEQIKEEMDFVKNFPNSIVSANILATYSTTWGKDKTKDLFENFSSENKNSEYGKKISRFIELSKEPKIGDQFVDFEMADVEGNFKKLSGLKAKAILLEFWASWCGPCRRENPSLVKTYNNFNQKGFEIFAVSLDDNKENWLKAIQKDSLIWEHVSDLSGSDNSAGLIYGVNGIPDNFLIDENGIIVGRNLRGEILDTELEKLLQ